jgi:tetratricopeptide (TPR) repeat protein
MSSSNDLSHRTLTIGSDKDKDGMRDTMRFDEFTAAFVRDGESIPDALDRHGRALVLDSRSHELVAILPHVRNLDLADHPYAQIFVGLLANSTVPKDVDLAFTMIDEATATFTARDDDAGLAEVLWVRGMVLLGMGDLAGASKAWKQSIDMDPPSPQVDALSLANLAYGSFCENGDVEDGLTLVATAVASARARGNRRGEGVALSYTGYLQIQTGRFELAEQSFLLAHDAFSLEAEPPYEWPMTFAGLGSLAGIRGQAIEADTAFLRGILLARQMQNTRYEAIVRLLRADYTMSHDARRAHADCRFAEKTFSAVDDRRWASMARRVRADVALAAGEIETAQLLAEQLLPRLDNPIEHSRCLLTAARAHLRAGNTDTAALRAGQAVAELSPTGASFVLVEALLLLAECDPVRAPAAIAQARSLTTDDPGFGQLWAARPTLQVRVLGRQSIRVGDTELRFRTSRAEHLILILALAGGRGVSADIVSESLWPGADAVKRPSNLSTAIYDARQALGSEAWRLHRSGSQFWLDLDGAVVDYDDAMRRSRGTGPRDGSEPVDHAEADRARAVEQLRLEILPTIGFEPWVARANQRRRAFLELLGERQAPEG